MVNQIHIRDPRDALKTSSSAFHQQCKDAQCTRMSECVNARKGFTGSDSVVLYTEISLALTGSRCV